MGYVENAKSSLAKLWQKAMLQSSTEEKERLLAKYRNLYKKYKKQKEFDNALDDLKPSRHTNL